MDPKLRRVEGNEENGYTVNFWDDSYKFFYSVARYHARRKGLGTEDSEDCAISFVERLSLSEKVKSAFPQGPPPAWLHRCASNHALNYCRTIRRRAAVECSWDISAVERRQSVSSSLCQNWENEQSTAELADNIFAAAAVLDTVPRSVLFKHYINGSSVNNLAQEYSRSPGAIEHVLLRARRRIRSVLARRGKYHAHLSPY